MQNAKEKLLLIANSEWALLVQMKGSHFQLLEKREHPQSKEKVENLVSDRPGRTFSRFSNVRHALNEGSDVIHSEREKFARELAHLCKERHRLHPFDELWVVAGPKFLGELRPLLQPVSQPAYSVQEIPKEISLQESLENQIGKIRKWAEGEPVRKEGN